MPTDLKSALAALEAHQPGSLLGLRETQWLDAKAAAYQLDADPRAPEELAKDVAAFANGGGGVIVIGIATRMESDEEVLDHIRGLAQDAVNVDQVRKVIRARVTPAPRGVRIGWSGDGGERVLFIDIPAQPAATLFVVAAPTGKPGTQRTDTVAVPVRDGDQTHWLPRAEIQALLSAGVRASGMPTAEALADLVRQAVSGSGSGGGLRVGQGLPDREREMQEAYRQLARAELGEPAGEAWAHGSTALQDLHHARDGEPGWVLCLVAGRPPVVVAAPIWQAIVEAGRHAPGHDPLAAIGLPRPPEDTDTPWVIAADSRSVDVDGGSWGAGRLACSGRGVWRWQPLPRFSLNQGRSAENWTAGQTPALRLRAVVNLPWAEASALEISKPRRTLLEQQLPHSAVAGAVTMLSRRRGADLPAARWERGPFGNSARSVGYSCTIAGPDGGPALKASVMLALPTTMESTAVACSDVLIENPQAWAAAIGPGWDTRLGLDEIQAVLLSTWETAAELLPDVVGDPAGLSWSAPPTTELRMTCEQPADNGVLPALDSLVDLESLGANDGGTRPRMAVTITAAPAMGQTERQSLLREALVHMARQFGYVDAEMDLL
ncbi:RNA-binding domain-containing protein [Streptomyces sp. NBC_00829]|uniref:RNA-binding domain-containing protein n=1 Tax=Streptomyces sp. NBC_00829 TaxID=2903679 RepID=UPI002F913A95|nr:putative DNA binding domain-containing protein [Streptomyces sp. NBC_00829]